MSSSPERYFQQFELHHVPINVGNEYFNLETIKWNKLKRQEVFNLISDPKNRHAKNLIMSKILDVVGDEGGNKLNLVAMKLAIEMGIIDSTYNESIKYFDENGKKRFCLVSTASLYYEKFVPSARKKDGDIESMFFAEFINGLNVKIVERLLGRQYISDMPSTNNGFAIDYSKFVKKQNDRLDDATGIGSMRIDTSRKVVEIYMHQRSSSEK